MTDGIPTTKARYRCLNCDHEFDWEQGASSGHLPNGIMVAEFPPPDECPECGHKYFEWLNRKA